MIEVQERTRLLRAWRESRFHLGNLGLISGAEGVQFRWIACGQMGHGRMRAAGMGSVHMGVGHIRTSDVCMGMRRLFRMVFGPEKMESMQHCIEIRQMDRNSHMCANPNENLVPLMFKHGHY